VEVGGYAPGVPVHDLTAYFLTTDRVHADEALASLRAQGIPRPVEVIRNVRPLAAAHLPTLKCETPFCLVLDDDTVLLPNVAQVLVDRFRQARQAEPAAFKLNARVYAEAKLAWDIGGLKMFYTPHLKRIGWPDAPHVSFAQTKVAREMGFKVRTCNVQAGVQKRGSDLDVYKKFLWIQIRSEAGQQERSSLANLVQFAQSGPAWAWFAVLGVVDGKAVGALPASKDEDFFGPIGRTLDFDTLTAEEIRRLVKQRGLIPVTEPS
jgi:hypothetical protein